MMYVNGLTKLYHPVLKYKHFGLGMDDHFFIVIESSDPRYDAAGTRALLEKIGGREISELEA
jgi:hypothetical protein